MLTVQLKLSDDSADLSTAPLNELASGQNLIVGRTPKSDWVIPDRRMSARHFKISVDGQRCYLNDLQSSNGTYLNGNRVISEQLTSGDQIRAGTTIICVSIESSSDRQAITDLGTCEWTEEPNRGSVSPDAGRQSRREPEQPISRSSHRPNQSTDAPVVEILPSVVSTGNSAPPVPSSPIELSDVASPDSVSATSASQLESRPPNETDERRSDDTPPVTPSTGRIEYCIVEICGLKTRTTNVGLNQSVSFGTSSRASQEINDSDMAPRHFRITFRTTEVRLECFEKENSVAVNGKQTLSTPLFDGDELVAGRTRFNVRLTGDQRLILRDQTVPQESVVYAKKPKSQPKIALDAKAYCETWRLKTGLIRIVGDSTDTPPMDLLNAIMSSWSLSILIDFFRFGKYEEKFADKRIDDGVPGSPGAYLISITKPATAQEWFEKIWQTDSAIFCFSKKQGDELRPDLEQINSSANPIFGLCWPSITRIQLENGNKSDIDRIFESIDFILAESDDAGQWQAYVQEKNVDQLKKMGLNLKDSNVESDENNSPPSPDADS